MHKLQKTLQILMALFILLSAVGPAALPAAGMAQPAHPALAAMAAEDPDQLVRVMLQGRGDLAEAAALVERLGGRVVKDLHIINALAAELTAGDAAALARSQSINWVSLDAPVESTGSGGGKGGNACTDCPLNYYLDTLGVRQVWDMGFQGQGVTVAVIDSGIQSSKDFVDDPSLKSSKTSNRILKRLAFNTNVVTSDNTGHGTHVAGIIGGNGAKSAGLYAGIAPQVNLISLNISDSTGMAYESDTVEALQWVLDNKDLYNIRVVNLSINSTTTQSYHQSPLDAAAEILWFNGIVVVASAGNKDSGTITVDAAPANDPFIITVGASKEQGTTTRSDDMITSFSAYGITLDGHLKPEIIAPGQDIVSTLSDMSDWDDLYPERAVTIKGAAEYFRLSGTSMAAPMVSGAAALLLQAEPDLTPDQVKYRLMQTGSEMPGRSNDPNNYAYLDIYAALTTPTTESANTGIMASQLLWSGSEPLNWNSVNWNSVNWNSVNWNSVNWNSVNWNSVNWNSVNWGND